MDRNALEQDALAQLNRGNAQGALNAYLQILKADAKDRRIRQKVAELLLKMNRPQEAEKHFREVAEALARDGQSRAAVSVLKQVVALRPDDASLHTELGEGLLASGNAIDARAHWDTALRLQLTAAKPLEAAKIARRMSEAFGGEPPLRLRVAELLEAGGDAQGASKIYGEVADEFRRRGRHDEVGRVAELALRTRPDDLSLLQEAAAARIEQGEWKKALTHLQPAFQAGPREARTLYLLSRAFEGLGQAEKAVKVLGELARVSEERGDVAAEVDALRRAGRLAPENADLAARLSTAEQRLERTERRLTTAAFARPTTDDEVIATVKASVYARYSFVDRALATLDAALAASPGAAALLASRVEVLAGAGRADEAADLAGRLVEVAGADAGVVRDRIDVLTRGRPKRAAPAPASSEAPEAPPREAAPPAPETPESRGDRLAEAGDLPGAIVAYREALAAEPLNEAVLLKIASLRSARTSAPAPAAPAPAAPAPAPRAHDPYAAFALSNLEESTFAEVVPDALDPVSDGPDLVEARGLVAMGMHTDALAMLEGAASLEADVLRAQAMRGVGELPRAVDALREAVNAASEDDPAYGEALFELAALYTATAGKQRSALRLLEELRDLHPDYRTTEVEARIRGLQRVTR